MSRSRPLAPSASLRRPSTYIDPNNFNPTRPDARGGAPPLLPSGDRSFPRQGGPSSNDGGSRRPSAQQPNSQPQRPLRPPGSDGGGPRPARPAPSNRVPSGGGGGGGNRGSGGRPDGGGPSGGPSARGPPPAGGGQKSKVGAALLSKRQSVSYAMAVGPGGFANPSRAGGGGGGMPPPPLPVTRNPPMLGMGGGANDFMKPEKLVGALNMNLLQQEDFDSEKFLKMHLNSSDPNAIRAMKAKLLEAQNATNQDLQKGVYKNYSAFIAISKEIATLENEMLELRTVLEDFKTIPQSLDIGVGVDDDSTLTGTLTSDIRRRTARNSIADVNALYKLQLEALWENIEGAQKYLPYLPGRHLQSEFTSFVELHPATYRPRHNVVLFLLNDSLLLCLRKRSNVGSGNVKLSADRCFAHNEIAVIDLKDGGDLSNAIKIKRGREVTIFRSEKPEDKKALLSAFRKVAEEMASKKRKQSIWEAEHRHTITRRQAVNDIPAMPMGASQLASQYGSQPEINPAKLLGLDREYSTTTTTSSSSSSASKDSSWVGDLSDELAVSISIRDFESAVTLIEKAKSLLPSLNHQDVLTSSLLRQKLDVRNVELVNSLLLDLSEATLKKSGLVKTASWLIRLGNASGESAREMFLEMRCQLLRKRCRMIKFEGDISLWVGELAMVVFTLIKNTCEWYMTAFRDNRMASGFVKWASQQVEDYASLFQRQVYGTDQDPKVIEESLSVTFVHAAMLKEVGLDFGFLLNSLLQPRSNIKRRRSMDQLKSNTTTPKSLHNVPTGIVRSSSLER